MQTINSYIYPNTIDVQVIDPPSLTRNKIVYSRTLKVFKNADNLINIQFKNDDQKPANLAAKAFTFSITSDTSNVAIWSSNVTISNVTTAIGSVTIDRANVALLKEAMYNYTVSYTSGNLKLPAYTDDNWGAVGQLQVISSIF